MEYTLNTTKTYHTDRLNSLGWELTICNALYPGKTLLRKLLVRDDSYGHLLYDYLDHLLPMKDIKKVIEIGGGYGYLMKDFLDRNRSLESCMLDISPYLLQQQKETLGDDNIMYKEEDFLETDPALLRAFDLAILNENLGDFPTLTSLDENILFRSSDVNDPHIEKARYFFKEYGLDRSTSKEFHINLGALEALEKLCLAGVPYIFLSEHSCEAYAPESLRFFISSELTDNPERITLMGHDEYTIKFSHLQKVAEAFRYRVIRGPIADFIPLAMTDELKFVLASGEDASDEAEMICHFVGDLYKYEYLILIGHDKGENARNISGA